MSIEKQQNDQNGIIYGMLNQQPPQPQVYYPPVNLNTTQPVTSAFQAQM